MQFGPKPAYQDESRPYPRFQAIRPCTSGLVIVQGASVAIPATALGYIDQDNPTTAFTYSSYTDSLKAGTTGVLNYSDSVGQKLLVEFSTGLPAIPSTSAYQILIYSQTAGYTELALNTGSGPDQAGFSGTVRVRPFLTPLTISGLTWNSFWATPPTLGSALTAPFSPFVQSVTARDAVTGSISSRDKITVGSEHSGIGVFGDNSNIWYGLLIDTKYADLSTLTPANYYFRVTFKVVPIFNSSSPTSNVFAIAVP